MKETRIREKYKIKKKIGKYQKLVQNIEYKLNKDSLKSNRKFTSIIKKMNWFKSKEILNKVKNKKILTKVVFFIYKLIVLTVILKKIHNVQYKMIKY